MPRVSARCPLAAGLCRPLAAVFALLLLTACSTNDQSALQERSVEELYIAASNSLKGRDYKEASRLFDEVERQHPYSVWATKAQLMSGYALYMENRYGEAIAVLNRFIGLHPGNRDVDYAFYLKALCYYEQISNVENDQKKTKEALATLTEVVRRFPDSDYARDAKLKMDLAFDHLAGKHMAIGRYYLNKGEYLAAINRFRLVVADYQFTTHVPEALHRLVESYLSLGLASEAKAAAAVLGYNYPGTAWYIDSYALLTGGNPASKEEKEG